MARNSFGGYDPAAVRRLRKDIPPDDDIDDDENGTLSDNNGDDDETAGSDPGGAGTQHLSEMADLLVKSSAGVITRPEALNYLMRTRSGRSLAAAYKRHRAIFKGLRKERTKMTTQPETLHAIAKDFGVVKVAKYIIDNGPGSITEAEFTKMLTDFAPRNPGERPDVAFARAFTAATPDGEILRKAHQAIRNAPLMAVTDVNGPNTALAQLQRLAEQTRKASPALTREQAFAKVYTDPANAELVIRERKENRPAA